jgi:hypothetical protein
LPQERQENCVSGFLIRLPYVYREQELQELELQVLQALPFPEGSEPSELLANEEGARRALVPHFGQGASSSDWLIALSNSNFNRHLSQTYSYIGII